MVVNLTLFRLWRRIDRRKRRSCSQDVLSAMQIVRLMKYLSANTSDVFASKEVELARVLASLLCLFSILVSLLFFHRIRTADDPAGLCPLRIQIDEGRSVVKEGCAVLLVLLPFLFRSGGE